MGGGSSAAITGTAALMGGSLLALGGSTAQAGGLIGDGSGDVIAMDANSIVKIGAPVTASAGGAHPAPSSAVAAFSGSIYGSVVANGTFSVTGGGALFIDMNGTEKSDPDASTPTISGTGHAVAHRRQHPRSRRGGQHRDPVRPAPLQRWCWARFRPAPSPALPPEIRSSWTGP